MNRRTEKKIFIQYNSLCLLVEAVSIHCEQFFFRNCLESIVNLVEPRFRRIAIAPNAVLHLSEHQLARIELRTVRWQIEEEDVERIEKRAQHDRHHRRRVHFRTTLQFRV
jgi:hypothetical protein